MNRLKRLALNETSIAVLLITLVGGITYAPLIPRLGFYRDDWYLIWSGMARGAASIVDVFASDRPFMGMIYAGEYAILGSSPLPWHIWAFALRLLGALSLLWLLRMLWPGRKLETTLITLLFLVYPGFLQQPVANTFQNHFMTYLLAILSIGLTVFSLRSPKPAIRVAAYLLSLPLALTYFLIYEYFIGLEGLRLLCLWLLSDQAETFNRRIKWVLLRFTPYLVTVAGFVYWRLFIFNSTRQATNVSLLASGYTGNPILAAARLGIETVKDIFETLVTAWVYPLYQLTYRAEYKEWLVGLALALIAAGLTSGYILLVQKRSTGEPANSHSDSQWGYRTAGLGLIITVITLVPMVLAGRDVHFDSQFDRYTLQSTIGAAMVVIGLMWGVARRPARLAAILALLGISVITHFHNAVSFADFWLVQKQAWQQLAWRAPQIAPGTTLFLNLPGELGVQEDYEIWAPANLVYYPHEQDITLYAALLNERALGRMQSQAVEPRSMRTFTFSRDYQRILVLSIPSRSACLHVMDGTNLWFQDQEDPYVRLAAPYSGSGAILPASQPAVPPAAIFGASAPTDTWCYYFELAELSNQRTDWGETIRLGQEALDLGYRPKDHTEWQPFLRAFAEQGMYAQGLDFASQVPLVGRSRLEPLCTAIELAGPGGAGEVDVQAVLQTVCAEQ